MPTRQCQACTHGLNTEGDCTNPRCELRSEPSGGTVRDLIRRARESAAANAALRRQEGHMLKPKSTMEGTGR